MHYFTYDDFTSEIGHLSFQDCQSIHQKILEAADKNDEVFQNYWHQLTEACVEYTQARGEWWTLTKEERQERDSSRTTKHEKVIFNLKIVRTIIEKNAGDTSWYDTFKDDRKRIGDFACYITYVYAINAR